MRKTKRFLTLMSTLSVVMFISGCVNPAVQEWPEMHGRVIDQDTGKPIPNAYVVVSWVGNIATAFVDARTDCFNGYVLRTDIDGRYSVPSWRNEGQFDRAGDQSIEVFAYKHNHHEPERLAHGRHRDGIRNGISADLGTIFLVKDKDFDHDEKLNMLWLLHGGVDCVEENDGHGDVIALYKLIEGEAKEQGFAKGYAATIENMRYGREVREFGEEEAYKRHIERMRKGHE